MPGIGLPGDDRQHQLLAAGANPDGRVRSLHRFRVITRARQLIMPARKTGAVLCHQQPDDLRAFLQPLGPLLERREGNPQGLVLGLVPGGAQAELQPSPGDVVDGDRLGR